MEKLDLTTPNFTDENIQKLSELFPNCVTEDSNGRTIDFDALRQELSNNIIDGNKERYQLTWPGKAESLVTANKPINKTLRPNREESKDFDNTENLYIEGDNLEVLKLLQETYLGKIKMIYIDPPYNTGKDFVYKDNFTQNKEKYDEESGNVDDEGGRLVSNPDSNGRYHSDWLSMMYPRLKLARNLLAEDGVIVISIGDDEIDNLRKICSEIYGDLNFVSQLVWNCSTGGGIRPKHFSVTHEYILIYSKSINSLDRLNAPLPPDAVKQYKLEDSQGLYRNKDFVFKNSSTNINQKYEISCPNGDLVRPKEGYIYRFVKETFSKSLSDDMVVFKETNKGPLTNIDGSQANWNIYIKKYLGDGKGAPVTSLPRDIVKIYNNGTSLVQNLFDNKRVFDNVKSVELIKYLTGIFVEEKKGVILDFFSGSATTAHAVMQLNAEDGGNRKFIMAQIPEATDEKSEAYKAGYKAITEIGKERIRRAGEKIKEDNADKEGIDDLDIGFRVLKVDSSNMKDVYFSPDSTSQEDLFERASNIKDGRTDEDLLFMVLLDWGIDLSVKIERREIAGKTVYFADDNFLAACFENNLDEDFAKALAAEQPRKAVLRDSGFAGSSVKINIEQIFKQAGIEGRVI
jgi:adenine-specific DNA-methyltransferase